MYALHLLVLRSCFFLGNAPWVQLNTFAKVWLIQSTIHLRAKPNKTKTMKLLAVNPVTIQVVPEIRIGSRWRCPNTLIAMAIIGLHCSTAVAAPSIFTTWIGGDGGGPTDWGNPANWSNGVANGSAYEATFGLAGSTAAADLGNANRSVGGFKFLADVNTSITTNGVGQTITTSTAGGECFINVLGGSHEIGANITGNGNLRMKGTGDITFGQQVTAATFAIGSMSNASNPSYTGTVTFLGDVHGRGIDFGDQAYLYRSPLTIVVGANIYNTYSSSNFFSGITVRANAGSHLVHDTYYGSLISDVTFEGPGDLTFDKSWIDTDGADSATWTVNGTGKVICKNLGSWDVLLNLLGFGILPPVGIVKSGSGMLEFQGTSSYTKNTEITGGVLIATQPAALPGYLAGKVSVQSGGTLAVRVGGLVGVDEQWSGAELDGLLATNAFGVGSSLGIEVLSGNVFAHASDIGITEPGKGFVKLGGGIVNLTAANTYLGPTLVADGTLLVDGSLATDSEVTVATAGTLAGSGIVSGPVVAAGAISPGYGIGTLTTGGTVLTGTYQCEIDGVDADALHAGALNIAGSTLVFSQINPPTATSYTIATYTGVLGGFFACSTIPAGYVLDYGSAGQIKLIQSALTGYAAWAYSHANNESANFDFDKDGMANGIEYFMGQTGSGFTANPPLVDNLGVRTVTWPRDPSAVATFKVQYSNNLQEWTNVVPPDPSIDTSISTEVTYTLPPGPEVYCRLVVTVP